MATLSSFEKQAVEELKKVEEQVVGQLVKEVSGKSITCCGWKWSLQISRQTPPPSPAKSEESKSTVTESQSPSKQEVV